MQQRLKKVKHTLVFLQTYFRLNYLPRKRNKILAASLLIQTKMRKYMEVSRERKKGSACYTLLDYLRIELLEKYHSVQMDPSSILYTQEMLYSDR
eukprot:5888276-Pyramimonas_sp.AAC.2